MVNDQRYLKFFCSLIIQALLELCSGLNQNPITPTYCMALRKKAVKPRVLFGTYKGFPIRNSLPGMESLLDYITETLDT
jgi:hypothetical protein